MEHGEMNDRDLIIQLLTQMKSLEKRIDGLQSSLQIEYKDMERRLGKAENAITAIGTKLAVYGTILIIIAPALSTLFTYLLNLK